MSRTIATIGKGQAVDDRSIDALASPLVRRARRPMARPNMLWAIKQTQVHLVWLRTLTTPRMPIRMMVNPVAMKKESN